MNAFLAFHPGDLASARNLLIWINQLRGAREHTLTLVADGACDYLSCLELQRLASHPQGPFKACELIALNEHVEGWIPGSNALWLRAAKHAEDRQMPFWLFLEPDAVPLKMDWLTFLEKEYKHRASRYLGAVVRHECMNLPSPYLEGCAIYPRDAYTALSGMVGANQSWTLSTQPKVIHEAINSPSFQHLWGEKDRPPTFALKGIPGTEVFGLDYIRPDAVLFHRNKDGTLIGFLRSRLGLSVEKSYARRKYPVSRRPVTVRRTGAIGDAIGASPVVEKLLALGHPVMMQTAPEIHEILRHHRAEFGLSAPGAILPEVNLDGAYEGVTLGQHPRHFHDRFFIAANRQLARFGVNLGNPTNCTPRLVFDPRDARLRFEPYPRPWVFINPKSNAWPNRTIPPRVWAAAAPMIKGTCFWVGTDPAPAGCVDLQVRRLDTLVAVLSQADLVITPDTGPMHIAAALNVPLLVINQAFAAEYRLSDQNDFVTISPPLECIDCEQRQCPKAPIPPCQNVPPEFIAQSANRKLSGGVSVIIAIYRPKVQKLNRCLDSVLAIPAVREIIVVQDRAGVLPNGVRRDNRVQYLVCPKSDIGYGRKINYGVRHSCGEWLWLLNDDCYPDPTALEKMLECARPDIGLIGHELRYPNGLIQHGGTFRVPGAGNFGHLDHNRVEASVKEPVEMENVTGASMLVRRRAFYEADGFDEDFYLYCEDSSFCLQLRRAGWRVWYTPFAKAIHEEHQSTGSMPNLADIFRAAQSLLDRKWRWYFQHNRNRIPGVFA